MADILNIVFVYLQIFALITNAKAFQKSHVDGRKMVLKKTVGSQDLSSLFQQGQDSRLNPNGTQQSERKDISMHRVDKLIYCDGNESMGSSDFDYIFLERSVMGKVTDEIFEVMSLGPNKRNAQQTRVFQYDPSEVTKPDPMKYGAYRRWKEEEERLAAKKDKLKKRKGDENKDNNSNNFYNAIKNLGSGPVAKGTSSVTGVAEPPPNKKPIQPRKFLGRGKRKIVTPADIDNLFSKKDDKKVDSNTDNRSVEAATLRISTFNPFDDAIPKWLVDAEKSVKDANKPRRKKKKITDDWRFWVALIAGVSFTTAFVNIYQQTGGSFVSTGGDELVI